MKKTAYIMILIGILLFCSVFLYNILEKNNNEKHIDSYITKTSILNENKTNTEKTNKTILESQKTKKYNPKIEYKAILEIPKIKLKRGLVDSTSDYKSINYAISVDKNSKYPNDNGNFIIYAHSGTGNNSYFKNLYKLEIYDYVNVYYNGIIYKYEITDTYEIEKNGSMEILETNSEKIITLLTCKFGTNKQLVFIGKLIDSSKY